MRKKAIIYLVIIFNIFLFANNKVHSQKSEIDNFEYTQELCEPKYWINIFDNFYTDSSKAEIIAIHQDSIYYYFNSIQKYKSKKINIIKIIMEVTKQI